MDPRYSLSGARAMKFLPLIFKNLRRHRRRNLLTLLSIAASIFIFSALLSLVDVPNLILRGNADSVRLVCTNKAAIGYPLPESYERKIAVLPHVVAVEGWDWFGGTFRDLNDQFPNYAVDADTIEALWPEWGIASETAAQFRKVRNAALVGSDLVRRYRLKIGDQITLHRPAPPLDANLQIVGILHGSRTSTGPLNMLVFNRSYLESLEGNPGTLPVIWVKADSVKSVGAVAASIDTMFANSDHQTQTEREGVFVSNLLASLGVMFTVAKVLAVLVAIAIVLVASNTASMSIRERTTEVAVMRAMGFEPRVAILCLMAESVVIAVAGGILGCAATFGALGGLAPPLPGLNTKIPMSDLAIVASLALACLIGIVSAIVPAMAVTRRNIVEGLRHAV